MSTSQDEAKRKRLKAALRENLRRRKAQARLRDGERAGEAAPEPAGKDDG